MKKIAWLILIIFAISLGYFGIADAAQLFNYPKFKAFTTAGVPLTGGKLHTYKAGTDTPKTTWKDNGKVTAHANPIVLDSNGEETIFFDGIYKIKLTNSSGSITYWTLDNMGGISGFPAYAMVSDYTSLTAAVTAIGSTVTELLCDSSTGITANTVIPATLKLTVMKTCTINDTSGTLTINAPFDAGLYQVFAGFVSGNVTFGTGAVEAARPQWWGFSTTADASTNATALQSAIDSNAPIIRLPNGHYDYSTGLTIDRALRFEGAGSCQDNGEAGVSTTVLHYTGTGTAIHIVGSGIVGKENIHLSDFSLVGNASALNGIQIGRALSGSDGLITKSSLTRVHIQGFTKTSASGLYVYSALEMTYTNVYAQGNYYGIYLYGTLTTQAFIQCWSRSNASYGWYILNLSGGSFYNCLAEVNIGAGLAIYATGVQDVHFFQLHSEGNASPQIIITGDSSPSYTARDINFYGGLFAGGAGITPIYIDVARRVNINNMLFDTSPMIVTANTIESTMTTSDPTITAASITGNHPNGIVVNGGPRINGVTMASGALVLNGSSTKTISVQLSASQGHFTISFDGMCTGAQGWMSMSVFAGGYFLTAFPTLHSQHVLDVSYGTSLTVSGIVAAGPGFTFTVTNTDPASTLLYWTAVGRFEVAKLGVGQS